MKNRLIPGIMVVFLMLTLALGAYLANIYSNLELKRAESKDKAVVQNIEDNSIKYDDAVVYERQYSKCGHIIIAPFANRDSLNGKNISDLRKEYTVENGFHISFQENTLSIKQTIDDWCDIDKARCRLKEYHGRVAVYKGPHHEEDVLIRVTEIKLDSLPDEVKQAIKNGDYEFENMERLNDALENLDEYL